MSSFKFNIGIILICLILNILQSNAQEIVLLWDSMPPVNTEITENETTNADSWITNVTVPSLEIYLPNKSIASGKAVIICPGGGYAGLAYSHEGTQVAHWLINEGIAAFILKYRMPNKHKEVPLIDAQQAIRYVRKNAIKYDLNPSKIGICGFSAGGHLASTASTHFTISDEVSTRPDFSILFYPVITMANMTHFGSRSNLLGDNPSEEEIFTYSNEKQVNVNTPPAILFLSDDDTAVLPYNSLQYYKALNANNIPASLHIFPTGGHGWGFKSDYEYHKQMTELLSIWLKDI